MLASWKIEKKPAFYFAMLLLLEVGMNGVFVALDFVLFYVFWELVLVPMYFLIAQWGGPRREYAAIKFFLYTLLGSVFMLVGIVALYLQTRHVRHGRARDARRRASRPSFQWWVFLAFFLGFAVKVPVWPLHTWLPDAHVEAPTAGSVLLAGMLLKMGTYGFLRVSLPILPDALRAWQWFLAVLAVDLDRLRRGGRVRADRPEEARRVLVGVAHGLRDARHRVGNCTNGDRSTSRCWSGDEARERFPLNVDGPGRGAGPVAGGRWVPRHVRS